MVSCAKICFASVASEQIFGEARHSMSELPVDVLTDAAASVEVQLKGKREEQARLTEEIERLDHELRLLRELLRVREGNLAPPSQEEGVPPALTHAADDVDGYDPLTAGVINILKLSGRPMHIQDLAVAVRAKGLRIPGKGANANLIAHIRTRQEIVRPVRGMYAMREWGFSDRPPAAVKRRRRTRAAGRGRSDRGQRTLKAGRTK